MKILIGFSQCDPNSLITIQTRASVTDANISWELKKHYSFYNPTCPPQNTLVVHLVGSYDNPSSTLLFPSVAANKGFHVVSLKYPNGTAAQSACGGSSDPNCYSNFRKEIIEGFDYSTDVNVDTIDCINNRLLKLLQYLELNNPGQNWSNYFSGNTILWNSINISHLKKGIYFVNVTGENNEVYVTKLIKEERGEEFQSNLHHLSFSKFLLLLKQKRDD